MTEYPARRSLRKTSVSFLWWGVKETSVVACLAQMTEETRQEKEVTSFTESFLKTLKLSRLSSIS